MGVATDTAWPRISGEVLDYLDFCRLRDIEAELRGVDPTAFAFNRREWEVSRRAEAELRLQHRRVRDGSYVPQPVSHFRVH